MTASDRDGAAGWKLAARSLRDNPRWNNPVTTSIRAALGIAHVRPPGWVQAHFPRVGISQAKLPNGLAVSFCSLEPEMITNGVFWHGWTAWEPEVLPLWFAAASNAAVVVDVGAHVGHHTIVASLSNPEAQVYAFEALPRVATALQGNLALNHCRNVTVIEKAAGASVGRATFFSVAWGMPSSSGLSQAFVEKLHGYNTEQTAVETTTLDHEIGDVTGPVLMKLDTETTEPDVLRGAKRLLETTRPLIFIEVLPEFGTDAALNEILPTTDYEAFLLTSDGPVARQKIVADARWKNHLLMPRTGSHWDLKLLAP